MKTFEEFKIEREKHEIATLICELEIDPDAYFKQILDEGIFKKAGEWWKKNITAPNVVRLKSSHDQALKSIDNFLSNIKSLRQNKQMPDKDYGIWQTVSDIRKQLTNQQLSGAIAQADADARKSIIDKPYFDIKNWNSGTGNETKLANKQLKRGLAAFKGTGQSIRDKAKGTGQSISSRIKDLWQQARSQNASDNPMDQMIQSGEGIPSGGTGDHTQQGRGRGQLKDPKFAELPGIYPNISVAHKSGYAKNKMGKLVPHDQAGNPNSKDNPELFGLAAAEWKIN